jgi:7-carboxy-7-deazaguanine synthase
MVKTEPNKYRVSEIFYSPQGEGRYTGQLTAWVRFFSCNLRCQGFSQECPTDPTSYINEWSGIDMSKITKIEQLPVFSRGCDSIYSVDAKFKKLHPELTADQIAERLLSLVGGSFWNSRAKNDIHLAFTGGEPLLPKGQKMIEEVMNSLWNNTENPSPNYVTIETNATQTLTSDFIDMTATKYFKIFYSLSPKLYYVSGEKDDKTINKDFADQLSDLTFDSDGQLKFVMNEDPAAWDEMEERITMFRDHGVNFPVWVMPVGSRLEQQQDPAIERIAKMAMSRGYNISARAHTYLFGNKVGT